MVFECQQPEQIFWNYLVCIFVCTYCTFRIIAFKKFSYKFFVVKQYLINSSRKLVK